MSVDDASAALSEMRYTAYLVGTLGPRGPHFMLGNWGTQASFDPWRFVCMIKRTAHTLENLKARRAFTINLVDAAHKARIQDIMRRKGEGLPGGKGALDAPRLEGSFAGFDCKVLDVHDTGGDHMLVVAEVVDGWKTGDGPAVALDDLALSYAG